MYDKDFCRIYNQYGWNSFCLRMGESILTFFREKSILIHTHLDFCSGTGDLCSFFSKQGIVTKGVDITPEMVAIAREKFPGIPFVIQNVVDYQDHCCYDLITCTCDAINHLLDFSDVQKVFLIVYHLLHKGGYFIFDLIDEENLSFEQPFWSERENDVRVQYSITKLEEGMISNLIHVYNGNQFVFKEVIQERLYSKQKIFDLLEQIGFTILLCDKKICSHDEQTFYKMYFIVQK